MFTSTEPLRPYSAEKLFTATRTSSTTSGFGVTLTTPLRWLELIVDESTMKLFDSVRAPFAFMLTLYSLMKMSALDCAYAWPPPAARPLTPGVSTTRLKKLRPTSGRSFTSLPVIRPETRPSAVSTSGTDAVTVTLSAVLPTSSRTLIVLISEMARRIFSCVSDRNPCSSTRSR